LQEATGHYRKLQEAAGGYKRLLRVRRDYLVCDISAANNINSIPKVP
jgi:hypothetical protein